MSQSNFILIFFQVLAVIYLASSAKYLKMLKSLTAVPSTAHQRFPISTSAFVRVGLYGFYNKHRPVTDPVLQQPDYFEKKAERLPLGLTFPIF